MIYEGELYVSMGIVILYGNDIFNWLNTFPPRKQFKLMGDLKLFIASSETIKAKMREEVALSECR